jgi:hypothetical protein
MGTAAKVFTVAAGWVKAGLCAASWIVSQCARAAVVLQEQHAFPLHCA